MVAQKPDNRTELIGYGFKKGIKVYLFLRKPNVTGRYKYPLLSPGSSGRKKFLNSICRSDNTLNSSPTLSPCQFGALILNLPPCYLMRSLEFI
jgi:hypothetical protein